MEKRQESVRDTIREVRRKEANKNTHTVTTHEKILVDALIDNKIGAYFEVYKFPGMESGKSKHGKTQKRHVYFPDIIASLKVDGKLVLIESHGLHEFGVGNLKKGELGSNQIEYLKKLNDIRKTYGFYVILVSYTELDSSKVEGTYVDEYWHIQKKERSGLDEKEFIDGKVKQLKGKDDTEVLSAIRTEKEMVKRIREAQRIASLADAERPDNELYGHKDIWSRITSMLAENGVSLYKDNAFYDGIRNRAYKPSFATSLFIDGRQVVFDIRNKIRTRDLMLIKNVREEYGLYPVLVTGRPGDFAWYFVNEHWSSGELGGDGLGCKISGILAKAEKKDGSSAEQELFKRIARSKRNASNESMGKAS